MKIPETSNKPYPQPPGPKGGGGGDQKLVRNATHYVLWPEGEKLCHGQPVAQHGESWGAWVPQITLKPIFWGHVHASALCPSLEAHTFFSPVLLSPVTQTYYFLAWIRASLQFRIHPKNTEAFPAFCSFYMVGGAKCKICLSFEEIFPNDLDHWTYRNFSDTAGLWNFAGFVSHYLPWMLQRKTSQVLVISFSAGPLSVTSTM